MWPDGLLEGSVLTLGLILISMTATSDTPTPDTLEYSGLATLQDASETFDPNAGPWPVHGVAMTPAITHGGSGVARYWPEETLRAAADLLTGRPIVKNYHDIDGQAPADDVIGKVTDSGYADGVGVLYQGEISDPDIARKVANGYLDVSVVPFIGSETFDADHDAHRVEEVVGFRDIAVVQDGAMRENSIEMGTNPAVSTLSAEALSQVIGAATLEGSGGTETEAETDAGSETGADPGSDATGDDDGDGDDPEYSLPEEGSALTMALRNALDIRDPASPLAGHHSIKDGAKTIDISKSAMAREALGLPVEDEAPAETHDLSEDSLARGALGLKESADDDDDDGPVQWRSPDRPLPGPEEPDHRALSPVARESSSTDLSSDAVARGALGLEEFGEAEDSDPDPDADADADAGGEPAD